MNKEPRWWIYRSPMPPGVPRHERNQQPCKLLARGRGPGPHNVLIRFDDGLLLVTIRRDKSLRPLFHTEEQTKLF
jgi:hypothetical protein